MAQKSLIAIAQQVAAELNLPQPTSVISSQDQNVLKVLALARAVCDDLLFEYDWQVLQTRSTFNTVSGQESYPFPVDIKRFISGTFFDANNHWPMQGPKTPTEWEWLKGSQFNGGPYTQYRVYDGLIFLSPIPSTTVYTFNFEYVSSYYVKDGNTGLTKADFTQDSDVCLFDHRPVVYGIKLKWKESIGQDTTANLADYNRALQAAMGGDAPAPKLNLNGTSGIRMLSSLNVPDGNWG